MQREQDAALATAGGGRLDEPVLEGKEVLTASECRRRIRRRSAVALVVAALTLFLVWNQLDLSSGPTVEATILERQPASSETFVYTVQIESGAQAGSIFSFDSQREASRGDRATLRREDPPQGLDFASTGITTTIFLASVGGAIEAVFVFGVLYALSDLRRLAAIRVVAPPGVSSSA